MALLIFLGIEMLLYFNYQLSVVSYQLLAISYQISHLADV